jgi:hypothetical protein
MHTACHLDARLFAISRNGRPATREDLLSGWHSLDRLAVVVNAPFGAVGASHLIQLAITAFYDALPGRQSSHPGGVGPRALYPEIYLFHVGGRHGDHSAYDFRPASRALMASRLMHGACRGRGLSARSRRY